MSNKAFKNKITLLWRFTYKAVISSERSSLSSALSWAAWSFNGVLPLPLLPLPPPRFFFELRPIFKHPNIPDFTLSSTPAKSKTKQQYSLKFQQHKNSFAISSKFHQPNSHCHPKTYNPRRRSNFILGFPTGFKI